MTARRAAMAVAVAAAAVTTMTACGGSGTAATGSGTSATSTSAAASSAATGSSGGSAASGGAATPSGPVATESNPPGDIPDNQAYVSYQPPAARVSLKVPEGWSRTSTGSTTSFSDKLNRIAVTTAAQSGPLTPETVRSTVVPTLAASVPKFALKSVAPVTRPAGTGVLVTYLGDSARDPVTGKVVRDVFEQYLFTRGGQQVALTLSGPVNADNVDPWRAVSTSLRWL